MSPQSAGSPLLQRGAADLGLTLTGEHEARYRALAEELTRWNRRANLTAITDVGEIEVKHVLDSLTVVAVVRGRVPRTGGSLIDVGSGAGFPGLPLAIALPEVEVTLLEATGKKVRFLEHVIQVLGLPNARILHARAEEAARDLAHRERYDVAVARAVATASTLVELLVPLLRVGGWAILMKTAAATEEVAKAGSALERLEAVVEALIPTTLPGLLDERVLVVLRKEAPTPEIYPRRPGIPQRRPL